MVIKAKLILIVCNHYNRIVWGKSRHTKNCKANSASVENFSGKLQHRDRDNGKKTVQELELINLKTCLK